MFICQSSRNKIKTMYSCFFCVGWVEEDSHTNCTSILMTEQICKILQKGQYALISIDYKVKIRGATFREENKTKQYVISF